MRQARSIVAILAILVADCAPRSVAQSVASPSPFGQRFDAFCLLFSDGELPIAPFRELLAAPPRNYKDWILVILGDPSAVTESEFAMGAYLHAGGSLLFANDQRSGLRIGSHVVWVLPGPVLAAEEDCFQGRPNCPLVTRFQGNSTLFTDIRAIATNLPGILKSNQVQWEAQAFLPAPPAFVPEPILLARPEGKGRYAVCADPSIFTNEMIQEADNARFAQNTVEWLRHGRDPKTLRVAVHVDGVWLSNWVDKRFETGQWQKPKLDTVALLNEFLSELQNEQLGPHKEFALNYLVHDAQDSLSNKGPWPVRRALLIAIASVVLATILWRIFSARHVEDQFPRGAEFSKPWLPPTAFSDPGARVSADRLLEHRQREIVRHGNYAAPLRDLAENFWNRRFADQDWRSNPPRVTTRLGILARRAKSRGVRVLWEIATGSSDSFISRKSFHDWRERIAEIDSLLREGALSVRFDRRDS